MRVCFLRPGPGPVEHAEALERAGADVVVAERAPEGRFDVCVACGWRVCGEAFRVDAARRAALVLRLEHRALAPERPERLAAVVALDLPLELLVTSAWLDAAVAEQHPASRRRVVPLGRPEVRVSSERVDGPLRVAGASAAVLAATEEAVVAVDEGFFDVLVALDEPLVEDLAAPAVAASPLAPILGAFATGATCVATPTEGRDELVVHRQTGLLADPDDPVGAARALDALARDRALLGRLRAGAREVVERWPTWEEAGRALDAALGEIVAAEPIADPALPAQLMANAVGEAAKLSAYEGARTDAMHAWAAQLEDRARALDAGRPSTAARLRARLRRSA